MADRYLIFRLVEGPRSRHRRAYLHPDMGWRADRRKALTGSLRKMRALAKSLQAGPGFLIIERIEERRIGRSAK